jgi:hypothetical protein
MTLPIEPESLKENYDITSMAPGTTSKSAVGLKSTGKRCHKTNYKSLKEDEDITSMDAGNT